VAGRPDPKPPTGVFLQYADGREVPARVVYEGCDQDGIDQWAVDTRDLLEGVQLVGIHTSVLPGRSALSIPIAAGPDADALLAARCNALEAGLRCSQLAEPASRLCTEHLAARVAGEAVTTVDGL
jgi:hypothetical protein